MFANSIRQGQLSSPPDTQHAPWLISRSPNRLQVFRYDHPFLDRFELINQVRSLSTVPARSTSKLGAGVVAGAAVVGYAAFECTSPTSGEIRS